MPRCPPHLILTSWLFSQARADGRSKFVYHDTLLEVSYLRSDQFQSAEQVMGNYHLAPSFRTTKILFDPFSQLTPLLEAVSRDYAKRHGYAAVAPTPGRKYLVIFGRLTRERPFTIR